MPHFLQLPLENILEALCRHCTPHSGQIDCIDSNCGCHPPAEEAACTTAIARLCATSRLLNDVATPYLYHRPVTRQWGLLARTLIARPDLAQRVKQLRQAEWDWYSEDGKYPECPQEVKTYYNEMRKAFASTLTEEQRGQLEDADMDEEDIGHNPKVDLLMSLCPNLEEGVVIVGYFQIFILCLLVSLPRLKTLRLSHADTEGGIHFGNLKPLTILAPNLSTLHCQAMDASEETLDMTFHNITSLRLNYSSICAESLPSILQACPRLEVLEYESGGSTVGFGRINPRDAQDAIVRLAPNLKALRLDLTQDPFGNGRLILEDKLMRSLAGLKKLESLSLDLRCLVAHRDPHCSTRMRGPNGTFIDLNSGPLPEPAATVLADLLPASIRSFRLEGCGIVKVDCLLPAISRLASVARGHFPNLRKVTVPSMREDSIDAVAAAFRQANVEFKMENNRHHFI